MALSAKLELRQGQQLVMTPQLQQAIRLLQLSNLELNEFVDSELERNPLLERDDNASAKTAEEPIVERTEESTAEDRWLDLREPVNDHTGGLDVDFGNVFQEPGTGEPGLGATSAATSGLSWANVSQRMHNGDGDNDLEDFVANQISLRDHLSSQLPLTVSDPIERLIGQYLIDLVDEAGYIPANLETLAQRLGAPLELVESVLGKLQTFDPPGIFARSLAECLALQLKEQNRYDPLMAQLLAHLDLLASRNIPALKRAIGIDMDELADMIREIKRLNPKPG
ncbi:MAG: RNA polymerase sigma-54 factor, partial [Hyphomicrobium sp.]|nr:RNA polymerase sigma-54 factor [Hyphomicrobium sp.]